jgi:cytochrome c biogenesis protein CcdA
MGITEDTLNAVSKLSKRFRTAAIVFGLASILCIIGIGLSFQFWGAYFPWSAITFALGLIVSLCGVTVFGYLEWKKKIKNNERKHEEEMLKIQLEHETELAKLKLQKGGE